jgi:hypothetical protein
MHEAHYLLGVLARIPTDRGSCCSVRDHNVVSKVLLAILAGVAVLWTLKEGLTGRVPCDAVVSGSMDDIPVTEPLIYGRSNHGGKGYSSWLRRSDWNRNNCAGGVLG